DDIHWGNLMTNNLRTLSVAGVRTPEANLLRDGVLDQLGEVLHGAGDPGNLAVAADGTVLVTFGGVDEVALRRGEADAWRRLAVGRRPTAVLVGPDSARAYVANTLADSI